jgi:hypothetical protein
MERIMRWGVEDEYKGEYESHTGYGLYQNVELRNSIDFKQNIKRRSAATSIIIQYSIVIRQLFDLRGPIISSVVFPRTAQPATRNRKPRHSLLGQTDSIKFQGY